MLCCRLHDLDLTLTLTFWTLKFYVVIKRSEWVLNSRSFVHHVRWLTFCAVLKCCEILFIGVVWNILDTKILATYQSIAGCINTYTCVTLHNCIIISAALFLPFNLLWYCIEILLCLLCTSCNQRFA